MRTLVRFKAEWAGLRGTPARSATTAAVGDAGGSAVARVRQLPTLLPDQAVHTGFKTAA